MDNIIRTAIASKKLIEFSYEQKHRIAEPHVYGILNGKRQLLVYQIGGQSSSGNLPNWRRMDVSKISNMQMLDDHFPGRRPYPSGEHSSFDTVLAVVS
ncbi:hypothetical protein Ngar_c09520 [Candidatus Nitrososphaera gargensis Ga9.2]|uniref:WYL domain-containing protein n=1 Tax=Nitrososphaera gargensis (strain Ga9.2) TaxID=1237085 RepID=K0IMH2_NITGG|nr:hypothetical protein [Candidatus Nitrososphaera gargensis]AFU57894.1 hypothetical protein Ngar_c09520 [Candidatus Nitrososphaera gargensis Ga9.2]